MSSRSHYAVSSLALILSRTLTAAGGFAVAVLLAAKYGASAVSDAYFAARLIPIILVSPVSIAFNLAFVPAYTRVLKEGSETEAAQLAGHFLSWTLLASGGLSFLYFAFAEQIVSAIAPGFSAQAHDWAVSMTRIMAPAIVLASAYASLDSVLNARRRYIASAFSALAVPAGALLGVLVLAERMGPDGLAIGAIAGFIVQAAVLFPLVRRYLARRRGVHRRTKPPEYQIAPYLGISILAITGWQINMLVDRMFGSLLVEGAVTALSLGTALIGLVPFLLAAPLYKVMYPELVERVQDRRDSSVRELLRLNVIVVVFATVPVTVTLMMFAPIITDLAFNRGQFDAAASAMTSEVIFYSAIGITPGISGLFFTYYFLASRQSRIIAGLFFATIVLNALLDWILMKLMGLGGIALATSLVTMLRTAVLIVIAGRILGGAVTEGTRGPTLKALLASTVAAAVMAGGLWIFQSSLQGDAWTRFATAAAIVSAGAIVYVSVSLGVRHDALQWLRAMRTRRTPGSKPLALE